MPGSGFVLASGSPRRRELLSRLLGADGFVAVTAEFDEGEVMAKAQDPERTVLLLADGKREAWCRSSEAVPSGETLVLAADTVVEIDGRILGKPVDRNDARKMLRQLSGRRHRVVTALSLGLLSSGRTTHVLQHVEVTDVVFADLPDALIDWYVATGEPMDKAGAYGIQGHGALLVERIEGCYYNVMGLPLRRLHLMILEIERASGSTSLVSHRLPGGADLFGVQGRQGNDGSGASDDDPAAGVRTAV